MVASPAIKAWSEIARPERSLAVGANEVARAPTTVGVDSINACPTIQTRAAKTATGHSNAAQDSDSGQ